MAKCIVCSQTLTMPYNCSLCHQRFCSTHRLPENHNCIHLRAFNTDEFRDIKSKKNDSIHRNNLDGVIFMDQIERDMYIRDHGRDVRQPPSQVAISTPTRQSKTNSRDSWMLMIFLVMILLYAVG